MHIWRLGGPEEDHQLHHCCWTVRVGEREEEEDAQGVLVQVITERIFYKLIF